MVVSQPDCSVIMAVYNDEEYIYRSVLSILNQTVRNFEFIVVDDHSTDRTPQILAQLARHDGRLRVVRNERNLERSRSRNRAIIDEAKTPFVAIVDSDDISMPYRLEHHLNQILTEKDLVGIGGQYHHITPTGEILLGGQLPTDYEAIKTAVRRRNPFWLNTSMLSRDTFRSLRGYDVNLIFAEDYDLTWRLILEGEVRNLQDVVLLYHWDWNKEQKVFYRRRLNHLKVRAKWLRSVGVQVSDIRATLVYLASALVPPQIGQMYQKHRYSKPAPEDFVIQAKQWLHTLNEQEHRLRKAP